jgi:hypothetical protein
VSNQFVGDTTGVDSADIYLKRLVLGLSVTVVVLLAGLAIYSVLDSPAEPGELAEQAQPEIVDDEPSSPVLTFPGDELEIDDRDYPLSIACVVDRSANRTAGDGAGDVHLLVIHNRGLLPTDYIVTAELQGDDGSVRDAIARVDQLRADERREVVLLSEDPITDVRGCTITGIQGDRRVLLGPG